MVRQTTINKYLDCFLEMYRDQQRDGKIQSPMIYSEAWAISRTAGQLLKNEGLIKMIQQGEWKWIGREPDVSLVRNLIQIQNQVIRSTKKPKDHIPKKRNVKKKVSLEELIDKVIDLVFLANKHYVPKSRWREFVKDGIMGVKYDLEEPIENDIENGNN